MARALLAASRWRPDVWADLVSPSIQTVLTIPVAKMAVLRRSSDDDHGFTAEELRAARAALLRALTDSLKLRDQRPQKYFAEHTALEHVILSLDVSLQQRRDADVDRGRKVLSGSHAGGKARKPNQAETAAWMREAEEKKGGSAGAVHARIDRREGIKPASVKKRLQRYRQRKKVGTS